MIRVENITPRKNIVKYQTQTVVEPKVVYEKQDEICKIISENFYTTNNETILVVKGVDYSEITLNGSITKKVTIKSLTSVLIKSNEGSIDEEWDELLLEKGACVQFQFIEGNWYILSSDGLKMG